MGFPYIKIDLGKITENTRLIVGKCKRHGIDIAGVTKSFCADPVIAKAIVEGGAGMLADARIQNLRRLHQADLAVPLMLLRAPMLSQVEEVVQVADYSLVTEISTIRALNTAAMKFGIIHNVVLMVELGDLREGILPQNILPFAEEIISMPYINLKGLGANFACFCGVPPTTSALEKLVDLAFDISRVCGQNLPIISAGNSANFNLLEEGNIPPGVNHLRIGEAILLGNEPLNRRKISGAHYDAFTLFTEIVEIKDKPSAPMGETALNALGEHVTFVNRGIRRRALAAIGRQDVPFEGLLPVLPGIEILGGSSDYMVLDVTEAPQEIAVGDTIQFTMNYSAVMQGMVSPYIEKHYAVQSPNMAGEKTIKSSMAKC